MSLTRPSPAEPATAAPPARTRATPRRPGKGGGLFRAAWRWHFYAAFLVIPVLLLLSSTGLIYLFRFQIEPLLHAETMRVEQPATSDVQQPYDFQLAAVTRAYPEAAVVSMAEPREAGRATSFSVTMPDGSLRDVFVDPWTAQVTGDINPDTTVSGYAVRLHGELMAGRYGDLVIEIAACWAIIMALTGYYLVWSGRKARARARSARRRGSLLRTLHARSGTVLGVGLLFLLVSGLPWTGLWGTQVQTLATSQGSSLWSADPGGLSDPASRLDESLPHSHEVPWGLGATDVPTSEVPDPGAGPGERSVASIDTAVQVAEGEGLRHPMTIALPPAEDGVFSVIGYAFDAPSDERTVHVDRFGGDVVSTYGYDDYPLLAQVVSQGIGLHEGRSLGLWSFWGAALMCLLVIAACLTGPLMWWRRRPDGARMRESVSAPRGAAPLRAKPWLLVALVVLAVLLPAFGVSVLVILLLDQLVLRRVPQLTRWFGVVTPTRR